MLGSGPSSSLRENWICSGYSLITRPLQSFCNWVSARSGFSIASRLDLHKGITFLAFLPRVTWKKENKPAWLSDSWYTYSMLSARNGFFIEKQQFWCCALWTWASPCVLQMAALPQILPLITTSTDLLPVGGCVLLAWKFQGRLGITQLCS